MTYCTQVKRCASKCFGEPTSFVRLRLRRPDWRTTVLVALSSLGLLTNHPGDHSPLRPDPPWSRPPPAPTAMTDVSKSMSRDQQLAATLAAIEDTRNNQHPGMHRWVHPRRYHSWGSRDGGYEYGRHHRTMACPIRPMEQFVPSGKNQRW